MHDYTPVYEQLTENNVELHRLSSMCTNFIQFSQDPVSFKLSAYKFMITLMHANTNETQNTQESTETKSSFSNFIFSHFHTSFHASALYFHTHLICHDFSMINHVQQTFSLLLQNKLCKATQTILLIQISTDTCNLSQHDA